MERCSHCEHWEKRHKRNGVCFLHGVIVTKKDGEIAARLPVTLYSDVCVSFEAKESETK